MRPTPDICNRLVKAGSQTDDEIRLIDMALILAAIDRPNIDLQPYRRHLQTVSQDVDNFLGGLNGGAGLPERAEALAEILHRRYGYVGTEEAFHDPDCANLTRVIDRRSGLPVALGIIYLATAHRQGWRADGLNFPGRFLVRLELYGERLIIDPFGGGRILTPWDLRDMLKAFSGIHAELKPRHYHRMSVRAVLVRLQENIRGRLLREDKLEEAMDVIETMLLFAPSEARLWRECGLLHNRLGNVADAIAALEQYLKLDTGTDVRYGTSVLLQELRQRLS